MSYLWQGSVEGWVPRGGGLRTPSGPEGSSGKQVPLGDVGAPGRSRLAGGYRWGHPKRGCTTIESQGRVLPNPPFPLQRETLERVLVVGGGAAGLMAAARAATLGARVLLVERTGRLGNKLRLTGGGHGNVSHVGAVEDLLSHYWPKGVFLRNALFRFGPRELADFFAGLGLPLEADADGRIFPVARNAHQIVAVLRRYCLQQGVQFRYRFRVREVLVAEGCVQGVTDGKVVLRGGAVILATGGKSYPQTGSTGDGYRLAKRLGHTITPLRPGLAGLIVQGKQFHSLQGIGLPRVRLCAQGLEREAAEQEGALLFTHYGLSGPAVLSLSLRLANPLARGPVVLRVDFLPDMSTSDLIARLADWAAVAGRITCLAALSRWVPRTLARLLLCQGRVEAERQLSQLSTQARGRLVEMVKDWRVTVVGIRPWREAMVTVGGVACAEVDPRTMASRRVPGLFLAGEVLDVAGESGGYNLQMAFSTGWLAGEAAARCVMGSSVDERFARD